MVAIIKSNTSIRRTIAYNENKVKEGLAQLIFAGNYPVDLEKISHQMKLKRFVKRTELNQNAKHNTVHVSLNFSSLEHPAKEKLIAIATFYMERIGFAQQPYLVYQHHDAGHAHLHIVTINIQKAGKRIDLHKILVRKSIPATREIEDHFDLIRAVKTKTTNALDLPPTAVSRIQYGKMESKKSISKVLDFILNRYNYTNLDELNAVLGQYNLLADRGSENSKTFQSGGLLYKILDPKGNPIGMPIKASSLDGQPTLKFLQGQFIVNAAKNTHAKIQIKNSIERSLQRQPGISQDHFFKILQRQSITAIVKQNSAGTQQITYIDHKTKCVFSDKSLGFLYSDVLQKNKVPLEAPGKKRLIRKNQLRNH